MRIVPNSPCPFDRFARSVRAAIAAPVALSLLLLLASCATRAPAPVVERSPVRPSSVTAPAAAPAPPAGAAQPESDWRPKTYVVKRGDTLHTIALDHGLDYREMAAWNNIENPNLIRVGQVLRLTAPGDSGPGPAAMSAGTTTAPLRTPPPVLPGDARPTPSASAQPLAMPGPRNADIYKSSPKAVKEPYSEQALREMQRAPLAAAAPTMPSPPTVAPPTVAPPEPQAPGSAGGDGKPAPAPAPAAVPEAKAKPSPETPAADDGAIEWTWPASGKVITGFSDTANLKGIDIGGKAGTPVHASAAGKVVYAGTGLRGYGKLIIVKHNATFLSAYAHNKEILVREGQQVTRGQKIAEMGNTDSDQVKLHFEIRRLGKPVDPLRYLPPA
jgi:lipoprotein NlpD